MYRVYASTPTMKAYIWEFGSLTSLDEKQYISEMVSDLNKVTKYFSKIQYFYVQSIVHSQQLIRSKQLLGDPAYCSLRDVARCINIFKWLLQAKNNPDEGY